MNLNDTVWVQLTTFGFVVLCERWANVPGLNMTIADVKNHHRMKNGWYEFQLWDLMNLFGPHMKMGFNDMPIKNNRIEFVDPNGTPE